MYRVQNSRRPHSQRHLMLAQPWEWQRIQDLNTKANSRVRADGWMNRGSLQLTRIRENQLKVEGWEETNKTKWSLKDVVEGSSGGTKSVIPWKRGVSVWEIQGPAIESKNNVETRRQKEKSWESVVYTVPRMSCGQDWDTRYLSLWDLVTSVWLLRPELHDKLSKETP